MAGAVIEERYVQELERQFSCSICLEKYVKPRSLTCLHQYCLDCIKGLVEEGSRKTKQIRCPMCRQVTTIKSGDGVEHLPQPALVNSLQEMVSSLLQPHSPGTTTTTGAQPLCDLCPATSTPAAASVYCAQCRQVFCGECEGRHRRVSSSFQAHVTRPASPRIFCREHPRHVLIEYCEQCARGLCLNCLVRGHDKNHVTEEIVTKSYRCRTFIRSALNRHELFQNQCKYNFDRWLLGAAENLTDSLKRQRQELEKLKYDIIVEVTKKFDSLISAIRAREEKIERRQEKLPQYFHAQRRLTEYGKFLLTEASDIEVIGSYEETIKLMKEETKPPFPETNTLQVDDEVKQKVWTGISENIRILQLSEKEIQIPAFVPPKLNPNSNFKTASLRSNASLQIQSSLITLTKTTTLNFTESIKSVLVDRQTNHLLVRSAGEHPIKEYTLSGQPVRRWGKGVRGFEELGGLGIDTKRGLLLVPTGGKLKLFSRQGLQVGKICSRRYNRHRFKKLSDVTYCTSRDAYVMSDAEQNCVWYVDAESRRVKAKSDATNDLNSLGEPFFLTSRRVQNIENSEEILVSDSKNSCIQVFDMDGGHKETICSVGFCERLHQPLGVCVTRDGKILVCDHNRVVMINTQDGETRLDVLLDPQQLEGGDPISVDVSENGHVVVSVYNESEDTQSVLIYQGLR